MVQEILSYFKSPDAYQGTTIFNTQKLKLFWTSLWMIILLNTGISILISGVEALGWMTADHHAVTEMMNGKPILFSILVAVVLAPFIEELIFRAPITLFKNMEPINFKVIFYLFAFAFAAVHIFNFPIGTNTLLLFPLLVAPQFIAGMFLGMIRVKVGLWYAMLFHALYNGVLTIPYLIYIKFVEI